jgi:hypothetical protein
MKSLWLPLRLATYGCQDIIPTTEGTTFIITDIIAFLLVAELLMFKATGTILQGDTKETKDIGTKVLG